MNDQERKIISLLLNEMAFEGATKHFREQPPEIPVDLLEEIERIQIPKKYNGKTESYQYVRITFADDKTVYERCYTFLRIIRNNIIHANKAYQPDTPERLGDLLDWAERFIASVYETNSSFSKRAEEIKMTMNIETF
ncbi:MAG: hypothetical protein AB2825_17820 [Candidatus Thiodiazotropha endolucinida]